MSCFCCCSPLITADELSVHDFYERYAAPGRPVIITGLTVTTTPWTLSHVADMTRECRAQLRRRHPGSAEWGAMEDGPHESVGAFVDGLQATPLEERYLFDWSLPLHCPALARELVVPRYFANDFLQRTPPGRCCFLLFCLIVT